MRSRLNLRAFLSLLMVVCLLSMPAVALAKKGDNHFKKGLEFEKAQQWEQAAQEFTLAVAANPSNVARTAARARWVRGSWRSGAA